MGIGTNNWMKMKTKSVFLILCLFILSIGCSNKDDPAPLPSADFSFIIEGDMAPSRVKFLNQSKNSITYQWSFGDNQSSTEMEPSHIFIVGGTYIVSLTVKNNDGVEDRMTKSISIPDKPSELLINEIKLTKFPLLDGNGNTWDNSDAADIIFEIYDNENNLLTKTGIKYNLDQGYLPESFTSGLPIRLSNFNIRYEIHLFDYDDLSADDWIGGYYFRPSDILPTIGDPYPSEVSFGNESNDIRFILYITWE